MTPRYRYLSSAGVGILRTRMIGDVLERAPRPYTAQEISELTGISTTVVVGFLTRNYNAGRLSMREDTVHHPRHGWQTRRIYWRGTDDMENTFEADDMNADIEKKLIEGERPVSWRDGVRTVWSIDERETVATMRGKNVVILGRADNVKQTRAGVTLRLGSGTEILFRRRTE